MSSAEWNFTWSEEDVEEMKSIRFFGFRNKFKNDERYKNKLEEHFRTLMRDCFNSKKCKKFKKQVKNTMKHKKKKNKGIVIIQV